MRIVFLFAHRWLGLTAGVIFAIASLTGGILVYQSELNDLLIGPRVDITPGLVDASTIESSARRQHPDGRLLIVEWPTPQTKVFVVRMADGQTRPFLELDPGSGAVLRLRRTHILLTAIRRFHGSLLLGAIGRAIVTYSTVASIVSLLLGLYLWWPGIRTLARGFRIRSGAGFYALTYDLHQTSGVIALPLLLVMSVTGVLMGSSALRMFTNSSWPAPQSVQKPSDDAQDIDLSTAVRVAQTATGGRAMVRVDFPVSPQGVFQIWMQGASDGSHSAATRIALDRYTGAVLAQQDLAYEANMNDRLHFGYVGGPVVRVLYSLSCFIGAGLLVTGFVLWWKRGKPKGRGRTVPERTPQPDSPR